MKEIMLKGGKVAIVDDADFADVSRFSWYLETNGYVRGRIAGRMVSMHRYLMSLEKGAKLDVDHANGIRHDNQRRNLRVCTRSQNLGNQSLRAENTSGFKGVSWDKSKGKWQAKISKNGKQIHLGRFSSPEVAHAAYCKAADDVFGKFANSGITQVEAFGASLGVMFHASPNQGK